MSRQYGCSARSVPCRLRRPSGEVHASTVCSIRKRAESQRTVPHFERIEDLLLYEIPQTHAGDSFSIAPARRIPMLW